MKGIKKQIYQNIESLISKSFEEGTEGIEDLHSSEYKFKSEYLVRSKCFWSIKHFLQYIEMEIEKV